MPPRRPTRPGRNCCALSGLTSGANVNALDAERATPLAWAINADEAAALTLVDLGADPDIAPKDGDSPRRVAADRQMEKLLAAMDSRRPR